MQQHQPPSSTHSILEEQNTEELIAAISNELKNESTLTEDLEVPFPGGSNYSETSSSFTSVDVTQELNDLLRSFGKGGEDDDDGDNDDDDDDIIDIDAGEEDYYVGNETVLFEDVDTKDENDGSSSSNNNSPTAVLDENMSSLPLPWQEQKKKSRDLSSDAISTNKINDADESIDASRNEKDSTKNEKEEEKINSDNDKITNQQRIVTVPLKQFENALALIQDLENRIQVLEIDQQCYLEENNTLREETLKQASIMIQLEERLASFPKLLEETVTQESQAAAVQAEEKTKIRFWRKDMQRQEKELEEEKLKQQRKGSCSATTKSLKQSDFLKDVVERKEQEESSVPSLLSLNGNKTTSPIPSPITTTIATKKVGFFSNFRGWGNKNSNNNINNNKTNDADNDDDDDATNMNTSASTNLSITQSKSFESSIDDDTRKSNPDLDTSNEMNNGVEDDCQDEKVLDLMT